MRRRNVPRRNVPRRIVPLVLATLALPLWLSSPADAAPQEVPAKEGAKAAEKTAAEVEFETLRTKYNEARQRFYKQYREYRKKQDDPGAMEPISPDGKYAKKFAAAAAKHAGTEGAVPFLLTSVSMNYRSKAETAKAHLATLLASHADSPKLKDLTSTLIYGVHSMGEPTVREAMGTIIAKNPHADVKAAMHYARGAIVNRDRESTAADREKAVEDMRQAVALAPESRYGSRAKSTIYELEHLQVGMVAPDITGNDLDGVAFKLSDYRGKVVFLDFWGDW